MKRHQRYYLCGIEKRFTMIELLLVIAVVAIICGLMFPALMAAKSSALKISCSGNLRQNGIGLYSYSSDNNYSFPSPGRLDSSSPAFFSFSYFNILPEPNAKQGAAVSFVKNYLVNYKLLFCPAKNYSYFTELFRYNYITSYHALWMTYGYGARSAEPWNSTNVLRGLTTPLFTDDTRKMIKDNILMVDLVAAKTDSLLWNVDMTDRNASNHSVSNRPSGSNNLYFDGHVKWVNIKESQRRLTAKYQTTDFWW